MNSRFARFPARLLEVLLLRGVILWLLTRLMGKAVLAAVPAADSGGLMFPAWIVVMTASLTLVDLHRRRELTLLYNLGLPTSQAVLLATIPGLVLEVLLVMLPI